MRYFGKVDHHSENEIQCITLKYTLLYYSSIIPLTRLNEA